MSLIIEICVSLRHDMLLNINNSDRFKMLMLDDKAWKSEFSEHYVGAGEHRSTHNETLYFSE